MTHYDKLGTQRYRPLDLMHVLQRCPPSVQQHPLTHILATPAVLSQVNAALNSEGEVCCVLPWGHHAVLCGFSSHPPDAHAASQLLQRLRMQGFTTVPDVQDILYWANVRGSDDPDAPEMSVLPGMVATSSGVVAGRVDAEGLAAIMQQRVLGMCGWVIVSILLLESNTVDGTSTQMCSPSPMVCGVEQPSYPMMTIHSHVPPSTRPPHGALHMGTMLAQLW